MAKLTKIVNGEYIGGNKYKITSTGDGKSTIDFSPDTVLISGTPVGAEVLNEIQKNGLYTLIGTKRVVGQEDIYDCTFEGIENFDFEEINVLLKPNASSTMQNIFVNVGGNKYKITSISDTSNNVYANQSVGLTLKKSNLQAIKWDIYVHPTQAGYKHIPAGGAVGQVLKNNGDGSAEWGTLDIKDKLNRGNLPATIPDADTILKLYEKAAGQKIDRDLLYLNDVGTKKVGYLYFDKVTNGLFECIKQTDSTVNSTEFFVEYSVKSNHDRLTNLKIINLFNGIIKNGTPTVLKEPLKIGDYVIFTVGGATISNDYNYHTSGIILDISTKKFIVSAKHNDGNAHFREIITIDNDLKTITTLFDGYGTGSEMAVKRVDIIRF